MFVAASAERPPPELAGVADLVTATLPWASLLEGVLGRDPVVAGGLAGLAGGPAGPSKRIVSTTTRDGGDRPPLDADAASAIATAWAPLAFELETFRPLARGELAGIALDVGATTPARIRCRGRSGRLAPHASVVPRLTRGRRPR